METNKLLRRVNDIDKLRAAGLTDDEIKELKGYQQDSEAQIQKHADEVEKVEEFIRLKRLEETGMIDEED